MYIEIAMQYFTKYMKHIILHKHFLCEHFMNTKNFPKVYVTLQARAHCIKLTVIHNSAINNNCHDNIACQPIKTKSSMAVTFDSKLTIHQLREALLQFKDVPLRTRRLLYKVYGSRALLVLNGTSLNCNNAILALSWRIDGSFMQSFRPRYFHFIRLGYWFGRLVNTNVTMTS